MYVDIYIPPNSLITHISDMLIRYNFFSILFIAITFSSNTLVMTQSRHKKRFLNTFDP